MLPNQEKRPVSVIRIEPQENHVRVTLMQDKATYQLRFASLSLADAYARKIRFGSIPNDLFEIDG